MSVALTPTQQAAVTSTASRLCILACAGSGKTTTLTHRIANHLNERGVLGQSVAAITFTVLAADHLRIQLSDLVTDKQALSEMFVGTIHGFCLQLLRDADPLSGDQYKVLAEDQQFILLNRYWTDWNIQSLAPDLGKADLISRLIKTIDIVKLERLDMDVIAASHPEVARVLQQYQSFLTSERYFDFGDLLHITVSRLETDAPFRAMVQNRFKHLFVDEYQDVDPLQERLISLISSSASLTVVGDDDQAIYQFRGTDVRNIRTLASALPATDVIVLAENRRCARNITELSRAVVERSPKRLPKPLSAVRHGGLITVSRFSSVEEEAQFIVGKVHEFRALYGSYGEIAVLMRSVSSYGDHYLDALRAAQIPYVCKGDRGLFARPEIRLLTGALEIVCKEPLHVEHLQELGPGLGLDLTQLAGDTTPVSALSGDELKARGFSSLHVAALAAILEVRDRYLATKFETTLDAVIATIAALDLLSPEADVSQLYNVCRITQIVREFDAIERTRRLHRLCAYFRMYAHAQFDEAVPLDPTVDAVQVLTVHQAKGLEYAAVFVPMVARRRFPVESSNRDWLIHESLFDARRYMNDVDDERRLFYVAVTRARDQLFVSCPTDVGLKNPLRPSTFFDEARAFVPPDISTVPDDQRRNHARTLPIVTSHSTLEYFLTCPYRYLILKEYGLATPENPFFVVGRALHLVARLIHERHLAGAPLSFAEAEALFLNHLGSPKGIPPYVLARRTQSVLRAIKAYMEQRQDWIGNTHEVERSFDLAVPGAIVRGRIDLIVNRPDGGVTIVDWKTGRSHDYLRPDFQVQLYMLAAREQLGLDVRSAILHYIEEGKSTEFIAEPELLESGRHALMACIDGIQAKEFVATPGSVCTRCECRNLCPYRASEETRG